MKNFTNNCVKIKNKNVIFDYVALYRKIVSLILKFFEKFTYLPANIKTIFSVTFRVFVTFVQI